MKTFSRRDSRRDIQEKRFLIRDSTKKILEDGFERSDYNDFLEKRLLGESRELELLLLSYQAMREVTKDVDKVPVFKVVPAFSRSERPSLIS
eukprot:1046708-Amorphochlora_amoeboformis.AAC.1